MTPLCPSYVKWDSRWRPAGKQCTTLGTLELMLPWIGSWAIWMTQVCSNNNNNKYIIFYGAFQETQGGFTCVEQWEFTSKKIISLTAPLSSHVLFLIGCRLLGPPGVARLQLRCRHHSHRELLRGAPGNHRLHGLQPRPGNQSTPSHGENRTPSSSRWGFY